MRYIYLHGAGRRRGGHNEPIQSIVTAELEDGCKWETAATAGNLSATAKVSWAQKARLLEPSYFRVQTLGVHGKHVFGSHHGSTR